MTLCNCHLRSMHRVLRKVARRRRLHIALIAFTWNRKGNGTPSSINADHLHVFVHSSIQQKKNCSKRKHTKYHQTADSDSARLCASLQLDSARDFHTKISVAFLSRSGKHRNCSQSRREFYLFRLFFHDNEKAERFCGKV
jgi:hypothetical protein